MALGDAIFRSRAASLLRSSTPSTGQVSAPDTIHEKDSKAFSEPPLSEKRPQVSENSELENTHSVSPRVNAFPSSNHDAVARGSERQKIVRTIPTWVRTLNEEDEDFITASPSHTLLPPQIQIAHHNSAPSARASSRPERQQYRRFDRQQDSVTPFPEERNAVTKSRWRAFAEASAYPVITSEGGQIVTQEWLAQNSADYSRPWLADVRENGDPEKGPARMHMYKAKRRVWYVRAQRTVLRSPIVPMVIRMIVWFFSATALGLAASLHHLTNNEDNSAKQTASTNMAIVVDAVAMVYLLYITYDEYSGKPLGLRPAKAKMRLIFLDLFYIVFDSANLSLAFQTLSDPICTMDHPSNSEHGICARQKGLASVLLIALIAWLLTFSISVMRLIQRVTGR